MITNNDSQEGLFMTEDSLNDDDGVASAAKPQSEDWLLGQIVSVLINGGLQIPVTLTIGGSIVTGTMISGYAYFEELAKTFESAPTTIPSLRDSIAGLMRGYTAIYPDNPAKESGPDPFIHLKNAEFWAPGQSPLAAGKEVLWRGRLSSVDGFSIGRFEEG